MSFIGRWTRRMYCSQAVSSRGSSPAMGDFKAREVVFDAACLARLRELDPHGRSQLLRRVFTTFGASLERLMAQLLEARSGGDWAGMRFVAHTLKSSSATVGALYMASLCADVEALARQQQIDGLAARIDEMQIESVAICRAVQRLLEPSA